jgi:hypothetical protein
LPVYGEYFEEYVLAAHELAPSLLMYPDFYQTYWRYGGN